MAVGLLHATILPVMSQHTSKDKNALLTVTTLADNLSNQHNTKQSTLLN